MHKVRRFWIALAATSILIMNPGIAEAKPVDSAFVSSTSVTVANLTDTNLRESSAYLLRNGNTLVSWLEEFEDTTWLKTRVVSPSNTLGPTVTVNQDSPAFPGTGVNLLPHISSNEKGDLFATWVTQATTESEINQTILGATSSDGQTWTVPFTVVPTRIFVLDSVCEDFYSMGDCGYFNIYSAINEQKQLTVATATYQSEGKSKLSVTSSKTGSSWTELTRIGGFSSDSDVDLTGLSKGFIIGYATSSRGQTEASSVYMSHLSDAGSSWSKVQRASFKTANTSFHIKWVERNSKLASLVIASEINAGGLAVRNFDLANVRWTGLSELWQPVPNRFVFQKISATTYGSSLAVQYSTYDQKNGATSLLTAVQSAIGGKVNIKTLENGRDQIDPLFTGTSSGSIPFFAYQFSAGTHVTVLANNTARVMRIPLATGTYVGSMVIDKQDNLRAAVWEGDGGIYSVSLVQGKLKIPKN